MFNASVATAAKATTKHQVLTWHEGNPEKKTVGPNLCKYFRARRCSHAPAQPTDSKQPPLAAGFIHMHDGLYGLIKQQQLENIAVS